MEGLLFYTLAWSFWIIATFFVNKTSPYRLKVSIWLLLLICLSPYYFSIDGFQLDLALAFMIVTFIAYSSSFTKRSLAYFLISSLIITLAYVSFHLFALFDPIWVIFKMEWMLAGMLAYLTILLQSDKILRLITMLAGASQGEILYSLVLKKLSIIYQAGSLAFFDVSMLAAAIVLGWNLLEYSSVYFDHHFNTLEREKQKSS